MMTSATQTLSLLAGLRAAFRQAGEGLLANPLSYEGTTGAAREKINGLLNGYSPSDEEAESLAYPLRVSRRFADGEEYGPARFRALEKNFLRREGYLRGLWDASLRPGLDTSPAPQTERTIPSPPPLTIVSPRTFTFEECREITRDWDASAALLPEELQFVDLTGGEVRESRMGKRVIAGKVLPLPMSVVFDRLFERIFRIEKNPWDFPAFWVEGVQVKASAPEPDRAVARISCNLASIDELQFFILAFRALNLSNPIEITLEGRFEWREGSLYIPMKPVHMSGDIIKVESVFGETIPILVPMGGGRTLLALDLEERVLSKNPGVFVEGIAEGLK